MDKQFKRPLLIIVWAVAACYIAFAIIFIVAMIWEFVNPETYYIGIGEIWE